MFRLFEGLERVEQTTRNIQPIKIGSTTYGCPVGRQSPISMPNAFHADFREAVLVGPWFMAHSFDLDAPVCRNDEVDLPGKYGSLDLVRLAVGSR